MKNWHTNLVIAIGLVTMGIIAVVGWLLISLKTGTSTGTEIPIGIISGLTGVLTGKKLAEAQMQSHQSQTSQTLGQVAEVAQQGQTIADAIDSIKDTLKPKK
jgi:hypothetical protein